MAHKNKHCVVCESLPMLSHEHYFYKRANIVIRVRDNCEKSGKSKSTSVSRNLKKLLRSQSPLSLFYKKSWPLLKGGLTFHVQYAITTPWFVLVVELHSTDHI